MIEIRATPATIARVTARLGEPGPLLSRLGLLLVRESTKAFAEQSFDGVAWPERYPGQPTPRVNIAGVVADLNAGRNPSRRRFDPRPANVDTNSLRRSISSRVDVASQSVEVGSWLAHAGRAHGGGETVQPVTGEVKRGLKLLLRRRPDLRPRLAFLFHRTQLRTEVTPRPFVGVTSRTAPLLTAAAERYFAGRGAA